MNSNTSKVNFLTFLVVLHFWILDILARYIVLVNIDIIDQEVIAIALGIIVLDDDTSTVALV